MTPNDKIDVRTILDEYDKLVTELQISWMSKDEAESHARLLQKEKYKTNDLSIEN